VTGIHRKRKRTTSGEQYAAMLRRMLTAYGTRIGQDPASGLTHLRELEQALTDAENLGIYTANRTGGHSINELADILGVSKQAVHKRVLAGEQLARQRDRAHERDLPTARVARPRELPPGPAAQ
jgi:predicted DNA binding protein